MTGRTALFSEPPVIIVQHDGHYVSMHVHDVDVAPGGVRVTLLQTNDPCGRRRHLRGIGYGLTVAQATHAARAAIAVIP